MRSIEAPDSSSARASVKIMARNVPGREGTRQLARRPERRVYCRSSLHRLPADIAAAEAFRPFDAIDGLIGAPLRLQHGLARRADVQHAAAIGENGAVLRHRAGVKDLDALDFGGVIEPVDARALLVVAGIALGRHHHGERRHRGNQRRSKCFSSPSQAASSAGTMSDIIRSISTWHSGSPKRTLYSISFGPCAVIIRPA